jgi:hypothetical protein
MGVFGGDFAVGRLAPSSSSSVATVFAVEVREESVILVLVNGTLTPCTEKVKVGVDLRDPET